MIYADYNSTSPLRPSVLASMEPYFCEDFVNPLSIYPQAKTVREAIENARAEVARLVGVEAEQVVFVSGATEACFLGIVGGALANEGRKQLLCSAVEHPAVLQSCEFLRSLGYSSQAIPVSETGELQFDALLLALGKDTAIGSFMLANNETGVIFPVQEIAQACHAQGAAIHGDGSQAVGKVPVQFPNLGLDFLSFSAHKLGGPKGIGALVIADNKKYCPMLVGGGQEQGRRGGTPAVPQIVGFGEAARLCRVLLSEYQRPVEQCRDLFEQQLLAQLSECVINGQAVWRLPNTSCLTIKGVSALDLVQTLGGLGVMISAGSACSSLKAEPSHVLRAMGLSNLDCLSTIRVSFGPDVNKELVSELARILVKEIITARMSLEHDLSSRLVVGQ